MKYLALFFVLAFGGTTLAETTIVVGSHALLPDTPNQQIPIFAEGDDQVRGFNLRSQIGDGTGPLVEPFFTAIDFSDGIWGDQMTLIGGPVVGAEQFAQASIALSDEFAMVTSNGLIARLVVSTVGLQEGDFALSLAETEIGKDSDFITIGGGSILPIITNGAIHIVPEPSGLGIFSCCGAAFYFSTTLRRQRLAATNYKVTVKAS